MSDVATRVVLPPTSTPPGFDVNVVSGRVSFWLEALEEDSLLLTIGPPAHLPVFFVVNVPGLKASPAACVPTNDWFR